MFLKVADMVDMDAILDRFKNWPDRIIDVQVTSPQLTVISISQSVLIRSSYNLKIRLTWMKSQISFRTGKIGSFEPLQT